MRRAFAAPAEQLPIAGINTTPLIDVLLVLLVLLVMFILCVPAMTHKVAVDLPSPGPGVPRTLHRLTIDAAGVARLDGVAGGLEPRLAALAGDAGRACPSPPIRRRATNGSISRSPR